ncbi:hypothetical protein JL720_6561 [Aureococcus anophagefferens]|nr:hypothetical protein JL720_6561 [Aureococcus anophagefferens]
MAQLAKARVRARELDKAARERGSLGDAGVARPRPSASPSSATPRSARRPSAAPRPANASTRTTIPRWTTPPREVEVTVRGPTGPPALITLVDWAWDQMYQVKQVDLAPHLARAKDGGVFVFSYTHPDSFKNLSIRFHEFDRLAGGKPPALFLGNKTDAPKLRVKDGDVWDAVRKRSARLRDGVLRERRGPPSEVAEKALAHLGLKADATADIRDELGRCGVLLGVPALVGGDDGDDDGDDALGGLAAGKRAPAAAKDEAAAPSAADLAPTRAGKESDIPNFKGSDLGRADVRGGARREEATRRAERLKAKVLEREKRAREAAEKSAKKRDAEEAARRREGRRGGPLGEDGGQGAQEG